jgi:hypothetical protein
MLLDRYMKELQGKHRKQHQVCDEKAQSNNENRQRTSDCAYKQEKPLETSYVPASKRYPKDPKQSGKNGSERQKPKSSSTY